MSLIGYDGLTEQPTRREYSPDRGWVTYRAYQGPSFSVDGVIPALVQQGLRFSVNDISGGLKEVEIQYSNAQDGSQPDNNPDNEQTVIWELAGNDLQKDIFHHPKFDELAEEDQVIMRDFRNGVVNIDAVGLEDGSLTPTGIAYRDVINKGEESYVISQYVLKKTGVVALDWHGTFSIENVGKVFESTEDLILGENVPGALKFAMPSGEWLKRTPTVRQDRDGRWISTQEWWYADEWASLFYERVALS